jgi:monoamine oxidase
MPLDVAIVGGGVSGLYTAWRLTSAGADPPPAVAVFEASDRVGGRLYTINVSGSSALVEMGAMRLPASHVLVTSLLDQLGVPLEPFPNLTLRQMYLRGTPVPMGQNGPLGDLPYHLTGSECSNPFVLLLDCLQRVVPEALQFSPLEWDRFFTQSTYEGHPYWKWGFWNLISRVVSSEGYALMQSALGIESSIANWNSTMSLPMMALLTSDFIQGKFFRPANGWSELPEKLAAALSARAPQPVKLNHKLQRIRLTDDPAYPFELAFSEPKDYTERAAKLVLCLPRHALEQIRLDSRLQFADCNLPERLSRVSEISAFRYYVSYQKPWWQSFSGWQHGYAVTDLPIRQVFYGAGLGSQARQADQQRVLMASYADFRSLDYWRGLISMSQQTPGRMRAPSGSWGSDALLETVEAQLREMHQYLFSLPIADSVGFADWSPDAQGTAWHAWIPGGDLNQWIPEIRQPFPGLSLFICGEAFSNFQGWVVGAVGSAEKMLETCFELPRPSWLPASVDLGP